MAEESVLAHKLSMFMWFILTCSQSGFEGRFVPCGNDYKPFFCRGKKEYEPPRYMSINTAIEQLLEIEENRQEKGVL